jgi:hypothetical protein
MRIQRLAQLSSNKNYMNQGLNNMNQRKRNEEKKIQSNQTIPKLTLIIKLLLERGFLPKSPDSDCNSNNAPGMVLVTR